jgi:hypothetical protein
MNPGIEPVAGTRLYYLDDAGVLFSEARQELHLLNPTAAIIWSLLEEGNDEPGIVARLCDLCGVDEATGRRFVADALTGWRASGFIGDAVATAQEDRAADASTPAAGPSWTMPAQYAVRRYRMLSSHIAIRFSGAAQAQVVHPVLAHLESDAASSTPTWIDIAEAGDRLLVYRDREFIAQCAGLDALAPVVKSLVWGTILRDQRFFLDIHAGVVSDGARCILLPAPPGSGKSTLTAALVHAGFEFFSDEIALLADGTLDVLPVPLAICVKEPGIDALADRFPELRALPVHRRGDGKRVVYMRPPKLRLPSGEAPRPVRALVFPRFSPGSETALAPLPRADALQRLMSQCVGVAERLDAKRVERLVGWIGGIACYALEFGSTDAAMAAMIERFPGTATRGQHP